MLCCSPKSQVETLNFDMTVFGKRPFKKLRLNEVRGLGPNPIGLISLLEEEKTEACIILTEERSPADTAEGWPSAGQGERPLRDSTCCHLDLTFPASETVRKYISVQLLLSVVSCYGSPNWQVRGAMVSSKYWRKTSSTTKIYTQQNVLFENESKIFLSPSSPPAAFLYGRKEGEGWHLDSWGKASQRKRGKRTALGEAHGTLYSSVPSLAPERNRSAHLSAAYFLAT